MSTETHTAAFKIFHYYYKCYVPQHALYNKDYLTTFGIPTTGNREIDRQLATATTLAQYTIAEMAELLGRGINITLEEPVKSVEIYLTLREHLKDWERTVQTAFGDSDPPMDDLRLLDNLAGEVYKIARGYLQNGKSDSRLLGGIAALESRRAMSRRSQAQIQQRQLEPEHKPITENIAKEAFARSKRWR